MSNCNRREFITTSAGMLGGTVLGGSMLGCRTNERISRGWSGFKYSMCNESMADLSWTEQCQIVGNAGYQGVEIAAYTLVKDGVHEIGPARRKEMVTTMEGAGIECVGLHWLLAPPPKGLHFTTSDEAIRQQTIVYFNELIDFCGDLGGGVMIFGSPKQRNTQGISVQEAKRYFAEGLRQVANHAQQRGVRILIESLGHGATDVVNTLAEALELAQQVDHPAVQIMFDFNNTGDETEPFDVLLRKYHKHIHHVHVQEQGGKHLGTGNAVNDYVKAFQTL
jgi:D-psicose/D-tagatose/L-ribulose 3-epimerase